MSDTATTTAPPPDSVASADIPSPQDADSDGMTTAKASEYAPHSDATRPAPAPAALPAASQMVQMTVGDLNALMDARIAAQAASAPQPPAQTPAPAQTPSAHGDVPPALQANARHELGEHASDHLVQEYARLSMLQTQWWASADANRAQTLDKISGALADVKNRAELRTQLAQLKERETAAKAAAAPDTADAYAGVPDSPGETLARLHANMTPAILAETKDEFSQWPHAYQALVSGRVDITSWLNSLNLASQCAKGRDVVDEVNRHLAALNTQLSSPLSTAPQPMQPAGIPAPGNPGIGAPANPGAQGIQSVRNSGSGTVGELSSRITAKLNERFGVN